MHSFLWASDFWFLPINQVWWHLMKMRHSSTSHPHSSLDRKNMYWLCKTKLYSTWMSIVSVHRPWEIRSPFRRRATGMQYMSWTSFTRLLDVLDCPRNRFRSSSSSHLCSAFLHLKHARSYILAKGMTNGRTWHSWLNSSRIQFWSSSTLTQAASGILFLIGPLYTKALQRMPLISI